MATPSFQIAPATGWCGIRERSRASGCDRTTKRAPDAKRQGLVIGAAARALFDQLADSIHHRFRRGVDFLDQRSKVLAILWLDIELLLGRVGNEVLVLHGGVEGIAQHLQ